MNGVQPFFNLLELPFRVAQIIPHRAKLVCCVLHAVHKVRDFLIKRFHVSADSVHPGKRVLSIRHKARRAVGAVSAVERLIGRAQCIRELFRVLEHLAPLFELLFLAGDKICCPDFLNLILKRL